MGFCYVLILVLQTEEVFSLQTLKVNLLNSVIFTTFNY